MLLQNQGNLRISLRGHVLLSECALSGRDLTKSSHVFADDEWIPAGMYVLLVTGRGEAKWTKSKDGALIFHAFMDRDFPVWDRCESPLHLLNRQHSFVEPKVPALVLK